MTNRPHTRSHRLPSLLLATTAIVLAASGARAHTDPPGCTAPVFDLIVRAYDANGVILTRDPDRLARECPETGGNGVMFVGTKGKVAVWRYDLKTWPDNLKKQVIGPNELHLHAAENHHTDFINAVRTNGTPLVDGVAGRRALALATRVAEKMGAN